MTSWLGFVFQSAPWLWKILLAAMFPLWAVRVWRIWPLAGGWAQSYGWRQAVGIKPPRLLELADKRIGERIFIKVGDPGKKVQFTTCHELTHAFTAHLHLPTWFKEGLAMVMVDKFSGQPTVQPETLAALESSTDKHRSGSRQAIRVGKEDAMVYLYVRGYWLTRYIEETRPGLVKELLSHRSRPDALERRIAAAYEKEPDAFWEEIESELVSYFRQEVS
jgi:hypothetical protein